MAAVALRVKAPTEVGPETKQPPLKHTTKIMNEPKSKTPVCLLVLLAVLMSSMSALANEMTGQNQTFSFTRKATLTLPPSDTPYFLRVNEHKQITYLEIHESSSSYFYDTYNAFPYYETLMQAHPTPLKVTVHTFLHNNNPNQITVELIPTEPLAQQTINGHNMLRAGYTAVIKHYLKETEDNDWQHWFQSALDSFEKDNNHLWSGIAANQVATEFRNKGQYKSSIMWSQKAIEHFELANAPAHRWHVEVRQGLSEWRLNELDMALQRFQQVANHAKQLRLEKLERSAYNNMGLMHWAQRRIHQSIEAYQNALETIAQSEAKLLTGDISGIQYDDIAIINNMAMAYQNLGHTSKAIQLYQTKIKAANFHNFANAKFKGLINLGDLLNRESRHDAALETLLEAQTIGQKEVSNPSQWWTNHLQIKLASVYASLGLNDLAMHHFQNALDKTNPDNYKKQRIDILLSMIQTQGVDSKTTQQWLSEAENLLLDAKLKSREAKVLEVKAQQASKDQSFDQAIEWFEEAQSKLQDQHKPIQTSRLGLQIATAHQATNNHSAAILSLKTALDQLPQSMDRLLANRLQNALAYSLKQSGEKKAALQVIQQSIQSLNRLIPHVSHSKTQQQLKIQVDETLALFGLLHAEEVDLGHVLTQINQSQSLWQRTQEKPADNQSLALFQKIEGISFALENSRLSDETREELEGEIIRLNNQLDYLHTVSSTADESTPLSLSQLQAALPANELIIQFMTSQYGSTAWWIDQNQIQVKTLSDRTALADRVEKSRLTISDQGRYNDATRSLSEQLFEPLRQFSGINQLHVVVDEPLNVLPMGALPLPGTTDPLIDHYTIKWHSQLDFVSQTQQVKLNQALYFANPVHHHKDPRLPTGTLTEGVTEFATLMGTNHEVNQIQSHIPGVIMQGFGANRDAFKKHSHSSNILHMATHAFFNEKHPDLSALVLSSYDDQGQPQAAMVRAAEIRNMDLPHELVVLSGCETGLTSGNGLTGLTMSFLQAGAKNLVGSLWQVDDRVTSQMMALFYQNLKQGQAIDVALRQAQLHIKNQPRTRHPKFWAGWFHMTP